MTALADDRKNPEGIAEATTSVESVEVIRVLHIDDEEQQQMFLKVFVEGDPNIKVTSVLCVKDVLDLVETGAYDCLVSDYDMPDMDGITLAKKVRQTSQIPIIIYTGRGSEEVAERAFEAGIDDYIRKEMTPAHYQVLSKRIRQAVERKRAEMSLKESEERYRALVDNSPNPISITIRDKIVYANRSRAKLAGLEDPSKLIDLPSQLQVAEEDRGELISRRKMRETGRKPSSPFSYRLVSVDGGIKYVVDYSSEIVYMGENALQHMLMDVTEHRLYGERLEALHRNELEVVEADNIDDVAGLTLNTIEKTLGFDRCCFGVVKGDVLRFSHVRGIDGLVDLPLNGKGITVRAVRTGSSQSIPDVRLDDDYIETAKSDYRALSEIAVPVKIGDEVVAVLNVENLKLNFYTGEDLKLIEILAQTVASALVRIDHLKAIRASEEKYHVLIESSHDAVIVTQGTRIVFVNQQTTKLLGWDASELVGLDASMILDEGEKSRLANMSLEMQSGNLDSGTHSSKMVARDGRVIPIEVAVSAIEFEGSPAVLAFVRDVSDKMRYYEGIEALHRHAAAIASLSDRTKIYESTLDVVESIIGSHFIDFLELKEDQLFPVKTKGLYLREPLLLEGKGITTRAVRERRSILVKDTSVDADFSRGNIDSKSELAVPVYTEGRVYGVINLESEDLNSFDDVDRKLVETLAEHVALALDRLDHLEELSASESRYRILVENSNDSVVVISDLKIVYANAVAAKLRGYDKPEEIVGRAAIDFVPEEDRSLIRDRMIRRQRGDPEPTRYNLRLLRRDGSVTEVETMTSIIEYGGKKATLSIGRDFSDLQRLEEKMEVLHRHAAQLTSAQSVDEVSQSTIDAITKLMGFDLVSFLINDKGSLRSIRNSANRLLDLPIPIEGRGITAKAARERRTILVNDLRENQDFVMGSTQSLSELATPVLVEGEVAAVLNIESTRLDVFTDNDARILETIALHVASAFSLISHYQKHNSVV